MVKLSIFHGHNDHYHLLAAPAGKTLCVLTPWPLLLEIAQEYQSGE
jgi:hypothetical protein